MRTRNVAAAVLTAMLLFLGAAPSVADDDHDRARRALEAGEIMPLRAVIDRVEAEYPGQIIEVELESDDGVWLYEIKLLRSGGVLVELKVDAREGTLIGIKGRDISRGKRD